MKDEPVHSDQGSSAPSGGKYCGQYEQRSDCSLTCTLIRAHIPCPCDKASLAEKDCEQHGPRSDCPIRCTLIRAHIPSSNDKGSLVGNIVNNMGRDQTAP